MKILFVTHYAGLYGANLSMLFLIKHLIKLGCTIHVLLPCSGGLCEKLDEENIPYTILKYGMWIKDKDDGVLRASFSVVKQCVNFCLSRIYKLKFAEQKFDAVYSNSITINFGAMLASQLKLPHFWHFRETMEQFNFSYSLGDVYAKNFFSKGTDKFIVISNYVKDSFAYILPPEKVAMIYNGVSLPQNFKKVHFKDEIFNICITGSVKPQKGQLIGVKAIKELVYTHNIKSVRLHIIGGANSSYLEEINVYIKKYKLEPFVKLWGHQSDVHSILNDMDLGVVCAKQEAFGRVTIEYMLHSMPIIASNSGANAELLTDEFSILYPYGDFKELANNLVLYINNREKTIREGELAKKYASNNFSSERNAYLIKELLDASILNKYK